MFFLVLFLLEITLLFFLSKLLTKSLSKALLTFTKSSKITVNIIAFLFLPGVVVHELSHLLMAGILFVRTGEIEFMPEITKDGVKLGSVGIVKTDPIRRAIIGFAPVLVGTALVLGLIHFAVNSNSIVQTIELNGLLGIAIIAIIIALIFYLLFAVSNTMFSSRADKQGSIEILITLLIIFVSAYIIGFRPPLFFIEKILTKEVIEVIQKSVLFLLAPIIIDIVLLGIIKLLKRAE